VELGENDGPADTLFFHAPTTRLGQIRGDFARYTGSVALLSPYDSRDSLKMTFLSAPFRNFRFGVSYSPEWESNGSATDPRDQTRQNDVVELGAQYVQPIGDWIWGVSAAVVKSEADPVTQREDIDSWGVGTQLRRGAWTIGTAFVQRGQSNRRFGSDNQYEWNAGAYWRGDDWRFAGSYALTRDGGDDIHRFGVGGSYEITENVFFRMDGVVTMDEREGRADREGWAVISEIGFRF
jgi:predicted porin